MVGYISLYILKKITLISSKFSKYKYRYKLCRIKHYCRLYIIRFDIRSMCVTNLSIYITCKVYHVIIISKQRKPVTYTGC